METLPQEPLKVQPELPSEPPSDSLSALAPPSSHGSSFLGLRRELQQCQRDIQNLSFPPSPKMHSQTFYHSERYQLEVETGFIEATLSGTEV
jgi:hypothetical protein